MRIPSFARSASDQLDAPHLRKGPMSARRQASAEPCCKSSGRLGKTGPLPFEHGTIFGLHCHLDFQSRLSAGEGLRLFVVANVLTVVFRS